MPRETTSHYRLLARQAIREALEALPANATAADQRRAVRNAGAPFRPDGPGQGLSWPYQCYLREVRLALGKPKKPPLPEAVVGYVLSGFWGIRRNWLVVRCDWCAATLRAPRGGCLLCVELGAKIREVTADPAWRALRANDAPRGVL